MDGWLVLVLWGSPTTNGRWALGFWDGHRCHKIARVSKFQTAKMACV